MFVFTLRFIKIIVLGIMKTRKEKEIINEQQESTYVKRGKEGGKKKEKKRKKIWKERYWARNSTDIK